MWGEPCRLRAHSPPARAGLASSTALTEVSRAPPLSMSYHPFARRAAPDSSRHGPPVPDDWRRSGGQLLSFSPPPLSPPLRHFPAMYFSRCRGQARLRRSDAVTAPFFIRRAWRIYPSERTRRGYCVGVAFTLATSTTVATYQAERYLPPPP